VREHGAAAAVEKHRLFCEQQKLIEGEAGGRGNFGNEGREPEDTVRDFMGLGLHSCLLDTAKQSF